MNNSNKKDVLQLSRLSTEPSGICHREENYHVLRQQCHVQSTYGIQPNGNDNEYNREGKGLLPSTSIQALLLVKMREEAANINYKWIRKLTPYSSNNNLLDNKSCTIPDKIYIW